MIRLIRKFLAYFLFKIKVVLNNLKYRRASKVSRILITFTILFYAGGILSFVFGIFASDEWINKTIPTTFILTGVVIPILLISFAFLIQIIALILDFYDRVTIYTEQSKFLSALENTSIKTNIHRLFLSHLVEQWQNDVDYLTKGLISIHHNYWNACSNFFDYANQIVECTSSVPLEWWDKDDENNCDSELLEYKELQKSKFISRRIRVCRTFILSERPDSNLFFKIVKEHLLEKIYLYYIKLYDLDLDKESRNNLQTDFLLMDNKLLMVGKFQEEKRNVYYYDFHIMTEILDTFNIHKEDLTKIFKDPTEIAVKQLNVNDLHGNLLIRQHRKPIYEYDDFMSGDYSAIINGILTKTKRGKY
ncbi:MAG: hypothetical protein HQ541_16105 [Mariniphaga sp.]|nr:hypothetical protein [Mariniphaga sp.]